MRHGAQKQMHHSAEEAEGLEENSELIIKQPGSDTAALCAVKGDFLHCLTTTKRGNQL